MRTIEATASVAPEDLPALALARPQDALAQARVLEATEPDPSALSFARQAAGIVLRDSGEMDAALVQLRGALRAARASRRTDRVADVRATLGAALVMAGRTRSGLAELDAAAGDSHGPLLARVLLRRAYVLAGLGRHPEALADMRRALAGIRAAGDTLWEARALNNRAAIHMVRGALTRAEQDVGRAEELFRRGDQELEAVAAVQNRGVIAFCRGDLPRTLALYDEAARRYAALRVSWPELAFDRCQSFLAAGLTREAVAVVDDALDGEALPPTRRAELLYVGATAALADGDPTAARARAREACQLFRRQGREWWEARAELVVLRSRQARGETGPGLVAAASGLGQRLVLLRADDAPVALLLAGRLAADQRPESAHTHLTAAARYRRHESALVRATGWLGQALDRELAGDSRGVFNACGRGLDALDEHRTTLGSSELRALATGHGTDLAALALREAVRRGGARRLLTWSERWRATALTEPPVRPPREARLAGQLGSMRSQARRLDEARMDAQDPAALQRERLAWEQAVRHQRHQLAGTSRRTAQFDANALVESLGETTFVELVEVDGQLHVLTVCGGRVRGSVVGPVDAALAAVAAVRFVLRQVGRGRPASLTGIGDRMQAALLGGAPPGSGPVVIAPTSRLHATPWTLMPALSDRPVSVVPSAVMWQRARATKLPSGDRMVLIAGPGLRTGGAEVDVLARASPDAVLLRDGTATVDGSLHALDGARLAHVAAHGLFRPDSPMFSSLVLDDGPLTVHDLELLGEAPYRLVLSACDSGVMVPVGANELLGLSSALLSLGTAGIVCSVAEVNDEATVGFMLDLHRGLATGAGLAEVLLGARTSAHGDPVTETTAAAFVALGV